mgnify:CR=1 FL=1
MNPDKSIHPAPQDIDINDYVYLLPEERIAKFPLAERDASKLLCYRGGAIDHTVFRDLPAVLPAGALLLFNNTRVIHARLPFRRATGARIEVFCLEPIEPAVHPLSLSSEGPVTWKCLIGNNKKWKERELSLSIETPAGAVRLFAERLERIEDAFAVRFRWDHSGISFGELLHYAGLIPLPPYLKRDNTPADEERYQTVYARHEGSVAAPTAGLHFTDRVLEALDRRGIERAFVTLHVGAGTFQPVKTDRLEAHHMHEEQIAVPRRVIATLLQAVRDGRPIIPVGTTSMRTLESLYWMSWKAESGKRKSEVGKRKAEGGSRKAEGGKRNFRLSQWAPYTLSGDRTAAEALEELLAALDRQGLDMLRAPTQLLIAPGYSFRLSSGLITNFHQPRSTLLLLIAALVGDDWRRIYEYALQHDFRFLSYGDSSLLLPGAKRR